jgi:two-component system, cell cycle sensor histidine kinase DivJ
VRFQSIKAAGIAEGYGSLCERWIGERVQDPLDAAMAARLVGSLLVMPLALALAFASGGLHGVGVPAIVSAIAALMSLPMILSAAVYLTAAPRATGLAALLVYAGGLVAAAACGAAASPAVWLLAAAMPVEAWLVTRRTPAIVAGASAAAAVMLFLASSVLVGPAPNAALAVSAPVILVYAVILALRLRTPRAAMAATSDADGLAAVENAIDGVVARLSPEGSVRAISQKCVGLFGVSRRMLVGTHLIERVHVADRVQYLSMLADLRGGAEAAVADVRLRRATDDPERQQSFEFRTFRLEMGACRSREGELDGYVVVARDICADVAAREALEHALEEAESVQISKSRFLASVSHELRTPLNSIIGFSDILLHEMFGKFTDERQREYVQLIQRSGDHLLAVVNAILDVSKIEAGNYAITLEPFPFKEAAQMAHDLMAHQANQKGVTLVERVDPACGDVVADRRALKQILINLLSNSVKFTDKGGVVTVDAGREGPNLVFTVSDTGIGMSEEDLKKLGRPFFQIHNDYTRAYEGTGLGVSLVKGLVELHGGKLQIDSRPGEGTRVTVTIPQTGRISGAAGDVARVVSLKRQSDEQGADRAAVRRTA